MSRNPFLAQQWEASLFRNGTALQSLPYDTEGMFDLDNFFGRRLPMVLEIGPGRGDFFLAAAQQRPKWNFLGLEITRKRAWKLSRKAQRLDLENVLVINASAQPTLESLLPQLCADEIHIHFPDPWPKKRHHKRRLVQPSFLPGLLRVLRPGGLLCAMTDYQPYGAQILQVLDSCEELTNLAGPGCQSPLPDEPRTYYLNKKLGEGLAITVVRMRRESDGAPVKLAMA